MAGRNKAVKPYAVTRSMLMPFVGLYLLLILLARTAPESAGVTGPGFILLFSGSCVYKIAGRKRTARFVRIYATNRFYINAKESSFFAIPKALASALPLCLLVCLSARRICRLLCAAEKARLPLYAAAACCILFCITGTLYGFTEGMGYRKTVITLDLLQTVLSVALPVPLAFTGYRYGEKLDALMYTTDLSATYAVLYAFFGLLLAELLLVPVLILIRIVILRRLAPLAQTGKPRYLGDPPSYYREGGANMLATLFPYLVQAAGCVVLTGFLRQDNSAASSAALTALTGSFFTRFLGIVYPVGILAAVQYLEECYRLPGASDDIDTGEAQERYRRLMHRQCILFFPAGLFLTALSEPVQTALFTLPDDDAAMLLLFGSLLVPLVAFTVTCTILMALTKRRRRLVSGALAACVAGIAAGYVLVRILPLPLAGAASGVLIAHLLFVLNGLFCLKKLFAPELGPDSGMILRPLLLSSVSALVVYLAASFLVHVIGEPATCVLCFFAGSIVYLVLMAFFRGFEPGDLDAVPAGRLFTAVSMRRHS